MKLKSTPESVNTTEVDLSDQLEHSACPLGCAPSDEPVLEGRDLLHHIPGVFRVVRCRGCGLMRTDPRPSIASIGRFYPSEYAPFQYNHKAGSPTIVERLGRHVFDIRANSVPLKHPGRLLEIGCASGSYLTKMKRLGWDVSGIEPSPSAAAAAASHGLHVYAGRLDSAPGPTVPFDMVVAWMVLEHLHDPLAALETVREWVRPKGWLAISVPDAGSIESRLFKENWFALDLPRHLFHFTAPTLRRILDAAGWRVERILYQRSIANAVGSVGYFLEQYPAFLPLGRKLAAFPFASKYWNAAAYPISCLFAALKQTGRITVWAQRR
jgi:SAM-dependent methyltransferase